MRWKVWRKCNQLITESAIYKRLYKWPRAYRDFTLLPLFLLLIGWTLYAGVKKDRSVSADDMYVIARINSSSRNKSGYTIKGEYYFRKNRTFSARVSIMQGIPVSEGSRFFMKISGRDPENFSFIPFTFLPECFDNDDSMLQEWKEIPACKKGGTVRRLGCSQTGVIETGNGMDSCLYLYYAVDYGEMDTTLRSTIREMVTTDSRHTPVNYNRIIFRFLKDGKALQSSGSCGEIISGKINRLVMTITYFPSNESMIESQ